MALRGIRVLEFAGLAPGPYCGLLLSEFGADVIRVNRCGGPERVNDAFLAQGKRSMELDLKTPDAHAILKAMIPKMDVLIDPFRPGVMEKLCLGPDEVRGWNERLIYARLTGYGQTGPLAARAGHDINYLAISGVLSTLRRRGYDEKPLAPVNYLADFAGGGLFCAYGILLALFERTRSGKGQVVDAAMIDGVSHLSTFVHQFHQSGSWDADAAGSNLLDSGSPFYDTYATKDGRFMAVGAMEPQFYQAFLRVLEDNQIDVTRMPQDHMDPSNWPVLRRIFKAAFRTKTQAEWVDAFDAVDACVTPVLPLTKVMDHPHNRARRALDPTSHIPSPAPRLSRTPGCHNPKVSSKGQDTDAILKEFVPQAKL